MTFRIRKPYDRYLRELDKNMSVIVDDKVTGLYLLRMTKNHGLDEVGLERVSHNKWLLYRRKPFKLSYDLAKYSIFD